MSTRLIQIFRRPSAGGFTLGDLLVIFAVLSLVVAILYPVFARA